MMTLTYEKVYKLKDNIVYIIFDYLVEGEIYCITIYIPPD